MFYFIFMYLLRYIQRNPDFIQPYCWSVCMIGLIKCYAYIKVVDGLILHNDDVESKCATNNVTQSHLISIIFIHGQILIIIFLHLFF